MKLATTNVIQAIIFLAILLFSNCKQKEKQTVMAMEGGNYTCDCYSSSPLYNIPITFNDQVPGDLNQFNNQSQADCFAWQSFISLNWPTDTTGSFGEPYDKSFVQWETYMPKDVLFNENGTAPPPWGTLVSNEYAEKFKSQKLKMHPAQTKLLTFTSKATRADTLRDLDFHQAAPAGKPNWLGAQNSTNVWYEILLNKDYYDFVVEKGYYNARTQHDSVKAGIPINFPKGVYQGKTGAIELKAAWMEVPNPEAEKWKRYKLSLATVLDPLSDTLRTTTVALVGLHILHKTTNQPTWVWATFEQIDNVPGSSTAPNGYNFHNEECKAQIVQLKDKSTDTVTCVPNTPPPFYLNQAAPVPIQLTRVNTIDKVDAKPINEKMQNSISSFYPNSVWQYYELVDVIWSQTLQPDPVVPIPAPRNINTAAMQSGATIVANTTMESYVQNTNTCYSCHVYSHIAPYPLDTVNNNVFADFSFAIKFASYNKEEIKEIKKFIKRKPDKK